MIGMRLADICNEVAENFPPDKIVPFKRRKAYYNNEVLKRYARP
jgi:hypothetical protein